MTDIDEVAQTVLRERQGRDRGWWEQMRSCYWPDSTVRLSWYRGDGPGFVTASAAMAGRGDSSVHRLSPPVVRIAGDRAFAETPAAIEVRTEMDGVSVDLVSYTRIVNRLERRDGRWGILALTCVYERDTVAPVVPGEPIALAPGDLAGFRAPYAILARHLSRRGYEVADDLLGDDQPERTAAFYAETFRWLRG
ncbi:nuclear transport factor 2 family protein [Streptomyces sp. NPDC046716]|uniref:nuclear transport factor 2 family protein n=1 Tax=Streptomyces sp. NPDC046716 TaxID=3157093 RepID=UPI0033D6ACA1